MDEIIAAVNAIHASNTEPQQRKQCEQYCENLKQNDPKAPLYGHALVLDENMPVTVRFFGLQLLENAVRYKWSNYTEQEQQSIRQLLQELLPKITTPRFIADKFCVVFAELVERDWPQHWQQLDSILQQVFTVAPCQVLKVLQIVAEDTFVYTNPITTQRKQDLKNALLAVVCRAPSDYTQANKLNVAVEVFQACGVQPGNEGWMSRLMVTLGQAASVDIVKSTIDCITAYVDWIPADTLHQNQVTQKIVSLLQHQSEEVRLSASNALLAIVQKPLSLPELSHQIVVGVLLSDAGLNIMAKAWTYQEPEFVKKLSEIWTEFGLQHLTTKKTTGVPQNWQQYLSFLLTLASCDLMVVSGNAVSAWLSLLKHPVIGQSSELHQASLQMLDIVIERSNKKYYWPDEDGTAAQQASMLEYDEVEAYLAAFLQYKGALHQFLTEVTKRHPQACMERSYALVQSVVQSDKVYMWEQLNVVIASVISGLPKSDQMQMAFTKNAVELILNHQVADSTLIGKQLDLLAYFAQLLNFQSSELALAVLQKVFSFVTFTLPSEVGVMLESLSPDSQSLRRKACISVLKLGIDMADVLGNIYNQIQGEIQRLIEAKLVHLPEQAYLVEFQAAIIRNHSTLPADQKSQLYLTLYTPMMLEVQQFGPILANSETFYEAIGLGSFSLATQTAGKVPEDVQARLVQSRLVHQKLSYLANVYRMCLQRTSRTNKDHEAVFRQSPWIVQLQEVLPFYLKLVHYLHQLHDPQMKQVFGEVVIQQCQAVTEAEQSQLLGNGHDQPQEPPFTVAETNQQWLLIYRNWLRNIRECCYTFLNVSACLVPGDAWFYGLPNISTSLSNELFGSYAQFLPIHHWRSLVQQVIKPMIINCTKGEFLSGWLAAVIGFLTQKLDGEWTAMVKSGALELNKENDDIDAGDQKVTEEILNQKMLRDLTRAFVEIWNLVLVNTKTTDAVKETKTASTYRKDQVDFGVFQELVKFLLEDAATCQQLLVGLTLALNWKDTRSTEMAAKALSRILPVVYQNLQTHTFISSVLLESALKAVNDGYHAEVHDIIVQLVLDIYLLLAANDPRIAQTLSQAVPKLGQLGIMQEMDNKIRSEKNVQLQRKILRSYLQDIVGLKPGQWFRKQPQSQSLPQKMATRTREKAVVETDLSDIHDLFK